jgi:Bacterial Ig-like domain (group 3)
LTSGTLRSALAWANTTTSSGLSGPSTIVFDLPAGSQTITLSATFGTLDLTNTTNGIAVVGPGAGKLTIAGDGSSSVFSIETGTATDILSNITITGGSAATGGGAIANSGNLVLNGVALTGNSAVYYGGAINNNGGKLTVMDSTFTNNAATGAGVGGAINNTNNGVVTVTNGTFTGGTALQGGAIANLSGTLTVTGSSFMGNAGDFGGAIFNDGTATISSSTIANDDTSFNGGGIANNLTGTLTLVNDTIAFNTAGQTGGGINSVGNLTAINTTIAYNSIAPGGSGGGIDASSGNAVLYNTIVADNTAGTGKTASASDVSGSLGSASAFNMIGTGGGGGLANGTNGNLVAVTDPNLATSLANNGGPTETIALLFGSPAINAGSNALAVDASGNPLVYDQRGPGYPRIVDGIVDIGAFQRAPATTTTLTSSNDPAVYGQTVIFTAKVVAAFASTNAPTGSVTFMNGVNVIGTAPLVNGTATFAAPALGVGTDVIVAVYSGDSNFANSASPVLSETVALASTGSSGGLALSAATSYISTASAPVAQSIGLVSSTTVTKKSHGKASKKVVAPKHAVPHGGSSTKFHLSKKTAALKQAVTRVAKHTSVKTKKKK